MNGGTLTLPWLGATAFIILAHCFFVAAAVSIKRARTSRLREMARRGSRLAPYARVVLMRGERHLLAAQVGVFVSTLFLGVSTYEFKQRALNVSLGSMLSPPGSLGYFGLSAALICAIVMFYLVIAYSVKSVGYSYPESVLMWLARPIIVSARILNPFVRVIEGVGFALLNLIGLERPAVRDGGVSAEEIQEMVELSSEAGEIEESERKMLESVFVFSDTLVREVMTQRADIVSVRESASLQEVLSVFASERLSRLVVTGENLDDVKGILNVKDMVQFVNRPAASSDLKALLRKPLFVPNTKKTAELLTELRSQGVHLAIVLDEHGGVDGLVTVEDLVEELVGEILDEYDSPADELGIARTKTGDLLVDGSVLIEDLNSRYRMGLPVGAYDTIAGLIIEKVGRIPAEGEIYELNGTRFRVEESTANRIVTVRIVHQRAARNSARLAPKVPEDKESAVDLPVGDGPAAGDRSRISSLG